MERANKDKIQRPGIPQHPPPTSKRPRSMSATKIQESLKTRDLPLPTDFSPPSPKKERNFFFKWKKDKNASPPESNRSQKSLPFKQRRKTAEKRQSEDLKKLVNKDRHHIQRGSENENLLAQAVSRREGQQKKYATSGSIIRELGQPQTYCHFRRYLMRRSAGLKEHSDDIFVLDFLYASRGVLDGKVLTQIYATFLNVEEDGTLPPKGLYMLRHHPRWTTAIDHIKARLRSGKNQMEGSSLQGVRTIAQEYLDQHYFSTQVKPFPQSKEYKHLVTPKPNILEGKTHSPRGTVLQRALKTYSLSPLNAPQLSMQDLVRKQLKSRRTFSGSGSQALRNVHKAQQAVDGLQRLFAIHMLNQFAATMDAFEDWWVHAKNVKENDKQLYQALSTIYNDHTRLLSVKKLITAIRQAHQKQVIIDQILGKNFWEFVQDLDTNDIKFKACAVREVSQTKTDSRGSKIPTQVAASPSLMTQPVADGMEDQSHR